jgi:hypothetical protein
VKGAFRAAKRRFLLQASVKIVRVFSHTQIISQFRAHLNTRISMPGLGDQSLKHSSRIGIGIISNGKKPTVKKTVRKSKNA